MPCKGLNFTHRTVWETPFTCDTFVFICSHQNLPNPAKPKMKIED
jgi:hypothetical protein